MSTIPAKQIVNVLPGVLDAGGRGLVLQGLFLTKNNRVPAGSVLQFPDEDSVSAYFGPSSSEYAEAVVYFNSYDNSLQKPQSCLFAQYNSADVGAYLRGSAINTLTIPQLQALTGTLIATVDGQVRTASSLNLSSATSYTAAATLIQTGLNAALTNTASVTGAIAPATSAFTGSITGNVLSVTAITSGVVVPGTTVSGTGVTGGTVITSQIGGTTGGIGTYAVSQSQNVASGALTGAYGTLTVTAVTSGTLSIGQTLAGTGVTANTQILGLGTGTGTTGTYFVTPSQTVTSGTITAGPTPVAVTFDSVSGSLIVSSGIVGTASTIGYATGTLSTALGLTQATGAVISQGSKLAVPGVFMDALTRVTSNWGSFTTLFDPDNGSAANTQKLAFAAWVNAQQDAFAYVCWDPDVTPTLSQSATTSLGYILAQSNYSGTLLIYQPTNLHHAAFIMGWGASLDFDAIEGRTTLAFRSQTGLVASVTDALVAQNLLANGYNFYGAYATANQNFVWAYNGQISGPFLWADSYFNQIWLNSQLQLALMSLLKNTNSIPYNTVGYTLIETACLDPINQAKQFGAIRAGVTLSQAQIAEVNTASGRKISDTLSQRGWYIQVLDPSPQTRAQRKTPNCRLWYTDGQSVQQITLNSVEVQ